MNTKQNIIIVVLCTIASVCVIVALYAISPLTEGVYRGSFKRNLIYTPLVSLSELNLGVNSFYIAGIDDSRIYLGNYTAPLHMLSTNHQLLDSQHVRLELGLDSVQSFQRFRLSVDSPFFFLTHGIMPEYLRGHLGIWKATRLFPSAKDYSSEAQPINTGSLIMKSLSTETKSLELAIKTGAHPLRFNNSLLNKQVDGIFCLDGKLLYDKAKAQIVYIHYYRNEFLVADTSLNLILRSHTIDTFSRAAIKLSKKLSGGESMLAAPPVKINTNGAVYNSKLFVVSSLLSRTEDMHDFLTNTVIDIYDTSENRYVKSIYIPDKGSDKVSSLAVYKDKLIAITGNYINIYDIPEEIIN